MKEKIKYAGVMLICFIAVLFIRMPVMADDGVPATAWRDNAAAAFAGGNGTETDPYQITDGAQLAKIAKDVENGTAYKDAYFRLENDIDLSAHRWNPIGVFKWYEGGTPFAGFLDGNGKTITGLIVDERTEKNSAGLFGRIGDNGTATNVGVKDLNIVDARIYATDEGIEQSSSAILAGFVMANSGHTIHFDNISVSGTIVNTKVGKTMISGGLIGQAYRVTADNCRADVTIEGGDNTGGFVGIDCSSTYTNCKVTGKVTGLWLIGGFVGYASEADSATMSTYDNCIAKVAVIASDWKVGGFAGYMQKGKSSSCAALGDVTSSVTGFNPKVGGFAGEIGDKNVTGGAILEKCYAAGKVTAASPDYKAGGFVGTHTEGTYTDCSFDSEKNPGLAAYGEGDEATVPVVAGTTIEVSGNLCKNIYGGHTLSKVDAKEATHMTDGNIEYWICTKCGSYFSDAGGTTAIKATDVVIPKLAEHTADSTGWHSDADNHWNTCECGEKLNLSGHSFTWVIDKEATAEEKGSKHEQCTVCGYAKAAIEIPVGGIKTSYAITEGTGSSYALQSGSSLTVRGNGDFSKFTGIKVDGVQIGAENYEAKSGSTIVTLKSSYLNTLAEGAHSLEILWTDGSASTAFTIQQSESQKPANDVKELNSNQNPVNQNPTNQNPQSMPQNNTEQTSSVKNESPKTGEDDNLLILAAWLFLLGTGFAGVTYYRKRKHLY